MKKRSGRHYAKGAAGLLLVLAAWYLMAPQELGGRVAYAVISGNSMEPTLHKEDLAVVREEAGYEVGDAVAYRSQELGRVVLHRIVDGGPDGYILQGDNNDFLDTDRPREQDILGTLWFAVPRGGIVFETLRQPFGWAALGLGVSAVLGLFSATRIRRRRRHASHRVDGASRDTAIAGPPSIARPQRSTVSGGSGKGIQVTALSLLVLFVLASAAAVFAYTRPTSRLASHDVTYEHQGSFAYSAAAPKSPVYPDGMVTTADPIFLRLIQDLDLSFTYEFASPLPHFVSATGAISVRLLDPASGWERRIPLTTKETNEGDELVLTTDLDLAAMKRLVTRVRKLTGVEGASSTLEVIADVEVDGTLAGEALDSEFKPSLPLQLDGLQLKLPADTASGESVTGADPFAPSETRTVSITREGPNPISVFGLDVSIAGIRLPSLLIAIGALLGAIITGVMAVAASRDEVAGIARRYATLLVPVSDLPPGVNESIEVENIEALSRLAEQLGQMILHHTSDHRHTYLVPGEGSFYRYTVPRLSDQPPEVRRSTRAASTPPPPPPARVSPRGPRQSPAPQQQEPRPGAAAVHVTNRNDQT